MEGKCACATDKFLNVAGTECVNDCTGYTISLDGKQCVQSCPEGATENNKICECPMNYFINKGRYLF